MIIKEYKNGKKTICHISSIRAGAKDFYFVRTGSPKAQNCLCWRYENLEDAEKTAQEYLENIKNFYEGATK